MTMGLVVATWQGFRLPHTNVPEPEPVVISDVTVIKPGVGRVEHQDVLLRAGLIEEVRPHSPNGSDAPDLTGGFLVPGLIDMHVHLPPTILDGQVRLFSLLFLMYGVTSVRETGSVDGSWVRLREAIDRGDFPGPRVYSCGRILEGRRRALPFSEVVATPETAQRVVAERAASGASCIKVYPSVRAPELSALRTSAARYALPVVGHLPDAGSWRQPGVSEIEHVCEPRCAHMDSSASRDLVEASVRWRIAHTPTLVVYAQQLASLEFEGRLSDPAVKLLPNFWSRALWHPRYGLGSDTEEREPRHEFEAAHRARIAVIHQTVRALAEAAVPMFPGSDAPNPFVVPGPSLHAELELLQRHAGWTTERTLSSATSLSGAAITGGEEGLGTIARGAPADLLLFDEDPTEDLAILAKPRVVIAAGRVYPRAELEAAWRRHADRFGGALYAASTTAAAHVFAAAASHWMATDEDR